jgi:hypothetical protein
MKVFILKEDYYNTGDYDKIIGVYAKQLDAEHDMREFGERNHMVEIHEVIE